MYQVFADGVCPGHIAPVDAGWIVLEEKVVLALVINEAVGVVGPVYARGEMELRAILFIVEGARAGLAKYGTGLC